MTTVTADPITPPVPPVAPGAPFVRPSAHHRRSKVIAGTIALALAGTGTGLGLSLSSSPTSTYRLATASLGSVTESVSASGTIEPAETADVDFGSSGTVASVRVAVGDKVSAGEVLATLDTASLEAAVETESAAWQTAESKLSQDEQGSVPTSQITEAKSALASAKATLSSARAALSSAKTKLASAEKSAAASSASSTSSSAGASSTGTAGSSSSSTTVTSDDSAVQQDTQQVSTDQSAVSEASATLSNDETPEPSSVIATDEAAVATAKANLAGAQSSLKQATLTAPFAGTVEAVNISTGDSTGSSGGSSSSSGSSASASTSASSTTSTSSSPDVEIVSSNTYDVVVDVSSSDIASVKVGDQATITPSGATTPVYGTVASISKVASVTDGVATIPVTVDVTGSPTGLYGGVSADVSIVTMDKSNVLTVPTSAVHTVGSTSVVYELSDGKEVAHTVGVGATGTTTTEITSGLSAGAEVVVAEVSSAVPGTSSSTTRSSSLTGGLAGGGGFSAGGYGGYGGAAAGGR